MDRHLAWVFGRCALCTRIQVSFHPEPTQVHSKYPWNDVIVRRDQFWAAISDYVLFVFHLCQMALSIIRSMDPPQSHIQFSSGF